MVGAAVQSAGRPTPANVMSPSGPSSAECPVRGDDTVAQGLLVVFFHGCSAGELQVYWKRGETNQTPLAFMPVPVALFIDFLFLFSPAEPSLCPASHEKSLSVVVSFDFEYQNMHACLDEIGVSLLSLPVWSVLCPLQNLPFMVMVLSL